MNFGLPYSRIPLFITSAKAVAGLLKCVLKCLCFKFLILNKNMKRILVIAIIIVAASAVAFSQTQDKAFGTTAEGRKLIQFMTNRGNASGKRDTAALDRMLSDSLILTHSDGRVQRKVEYLDSIKAMSADFTLKDYDQELDIYDNMAIVRARYVFTMGGNEMQLCYTATFIKRKGLWNSVTFLNYSLLVSKKV